MNDSDDQYAKRVREGCFRAILNASITEGELRLNEKEIYDGVISAIAMIHASQDEAPTAEKTALMSDVIARHFRERVEELKTAKAQNGYFSTRRKH
jgi:hypothetical protein